jgi:hypothetical protein
VDGGSHSVCLPEKLASFVDTEAGVISLLIKEEDISE